MRFRRGADRSARSRTATAPVFLGNSITDGGHYHSYIWLYYMTRFPYMDLRVMNAGIGGRDRRQTCTSAWTATFSANAPRC